MCACLAASPTAPAPAQPLRMHLRMHLHGPIMGPQRLYAPACTDNNRPDRNRQPFLVFVRLGVEERAYSGGRGVSGAAAACRAQRKKLALAGGSWPYPVRGVLRSYAASYATLRDAATYPLQAAVGRAVAHPTTTFSPVSSPHITGLSSLVSYNPHWLPPTPHTCAPHVLCRRRLTRPWLSPCRRPSSAASCTAGPCSSCNLRYFNSSLPSSFGR
jgi:hypothetical protein